jgi:hypothetical protein
MEEGRVPDGFSVIAYGESPLCLWWWWTSRPPCHISLPPVTVPLFPAIRPWLHMLHPPHALFQINFESTKPSPATSYRYRTAGMPAYNISTRDKSNTTQTKRITTQALTEKNEKLVLRLEPSSKLTKLSPATGSPRALRSRLALVAVSCLGSPRNLFGLGRHLPLHRCGVAIRRRVFQGVLCDRCVLL